MNVNSFMLKSMAKRTIGLFIRAVFSILLVLGSPLFGQKFSSSEKGMVVAPTPEAVQAGLSILRRGGNAMDAGAATAFALMVTDPAMCSLGGRSQILIYLNGGEFVGIDGATQSPGRVGKPARIGRGYKTSPIPGSPAALEEMVCRFGTLPLRVILRPAIELAREGFVIKKDYHDAFRRYGEYFIHYPGTAKHFLKEESSFYSEGEPFRQPVLAKTLETIAEKGTSVIYRGELARAIVMDMKRHDGLVGEVDLDQYRPLPGEVVRGNFRGFEIVSRGDQCDGASVIEMLHILEHFPLSEYAPADPMLLHILAQSIYIGFVDEDLPDWMQVSKAMAARRVREIDLARALPVPQKPKNRGGETNHLSVVDAEGNAVAITQSIGPTFGSKVVNPELGFFYAYSYDMNDDPVPFQREKTSQSPTMVLKDGKVFLVLGSAGSSRIPASIVHTIVHVIDHRMPLAQAVSSPRCFLAESELRLETMGLDEISVQKLESLGYRIRSYPDLSGYFGRVHAIHIDNESRMIYGAADPRDEGAAGGY